MVRRVLAFSLALLVVGACASGPGEGRRDVQAPAAENGATSTSMAGTTAPPDAPTAAPADVEDAVIGSIIDGDTLDLTDGTRIRLIGIDTPETKDPRRPVECFGREAAARLASLVPPGAQARLVYDVEVTDKYGRTLAYLYRGSDDLFVNAAMVRDGYASAFTVPPNVAHADQFVTLQREAREAGRGLWGGCDESGGAAGTQPAPASAACDPSYADVCIAPPPPDLDCGDVPYRSFRVEGSDHPHGFDRDGDGVGCDA